MKIALIVSLLGVVVVMLLWGEEQGWFTRHEDPFKGKTVEAILTTKGGGSGDLFVIDQTITDRATVDWFCNQIKKGTVTKFEGFFGTLLPAQIFIDDKGEVITAVYCRIPEYRVCFMDVVKTDRGYAFKSRESESGIYDKEYVQRVARMSKVSIPSK